MSKHEVIVDTIGDHYYAYCWCGWRGRDHGYPECLTPSSAQTAAGSEGKLHLSSMYGREQEKHASTADWHIIVESPRGGTYTVIIDGLAEAVDYANTMRELGWTLIDLSRERGA